MNEFGGSLITVSRRDSRFKDYLLGNFSKTERALPVQSLNVNTASEQVIFQIVSVEEIEKKQEASALKRWAQILKLHNFYLAILPITVILVKDEVQGTLSDIATALSSLVGCLFLMGAVNLRNDYLDYCNGLDRVHPQSGSRAIQKGWITAMQVKKNSNSFLFLGILFGLPALFYHHAVIYLIGVLALLAIVGLTSYRMGLKYRRWSELTVFLLLGPMLTVGIQLSTGASLDWQTIFIGVITGWYAVFYLHLKNFEQLMVNHQAEFKNTITWLGFENGKKLLLFWWTVLLFLISAYQVYYSNIFWIVGFILVSLFSFVLFYRQSRHLISPVGSGFKKMIQTTHRLEFFLLGLWCLQPICSFWIWR